MSVPLPAEEDPNVEVARRLSDDAIPIFVAGGPKGHVEAGIDRRIDVDGRAGAEERRVGQRVVRFVGIGLEDEQAAVAIGAVAADDGVRGHRSEGYQRPS